MSEMIKYRYLLDGLCGLKDVFDVRTTLNFIRLSQLISSYKWLIQKKKKKIKRKEKEKLTLFCLLFNYSFLKRSWHITIRTSKCSSCCWIIKIRLLIRSKSTLLLLKTWIKIGCSSWLPTKTKKWLRLRWQ